MQKRTSVQQVGLVLLYLGLGAASALLWARIVEFQRLPSWHEEMVSGLAPAPNQYRPLTPWIAELLMPLMPSGTVYVHLAVYFTIRAIVTGANLLLFDRYLRTWFSPAAAAGGSLALAAIIPFTYYRAVQESDPINLLIFTAAFWALAKGRDLLVVPLVLAGTFNRETTAMLPVVYLVARWGHVPAKRLGWLTAALGICWVAVYAGLWLGYGPRQAYTRVFMLEENLSSWLPTTFALLFFGVMWVLPFLAAKQAPVLLRRSLWLVPAFVVLQYSVGVAQEVRLYLPLAPIVIPLSWWLLFPEERKGTGGPVRRRARR
jgi:hypothetical protein